MVWRADKGSDFTHIKVDPGGFRIITYGMSMEDVSGRVVIYGALGGIKSRITSCVLVIYCVSTELPALSSNYNPPS